MIKMYCLLTNMITQFLVIKQLNTLSTKLSDKLNTIENNLKIKDVI